MSSVFNPNCIVNEIYELLGRWWVYGHKFSPDNIPIWRDLLRGFGDRAIMERYSESLDESSEFAPIFFQISSPFSGNRQKVSV
jgi:hypothetical protein